MKVSKNFILQEFIDPEIYQIKKEKSIELIDRRIVLVAQLIKEIFDVPVMINNWHEGGGYKESGLRKFLTKTGAPFSQHKYGRAADLKIEGWDDYEKVRDVIRDYWDNLRVLGLTTIETGTPTWLHIDCRFTGSNHLHEIPYTN
jgi:hypothetical protein